MTPCRSLLAAAALVCIAPLHTHADDALPALELGAHRIAVVADPDSTVCVQPDDRCFGLAFDDGRVLAWPTPELAAPRLEPAALESEPVALVVGRYQAAVLRPSDTTLAPLDPAFRDEGSDSQSGMLTGVRIVGEHLVGYQVDAGHFLFDLDDPAVPIEVPAAVTFQAAGASASLFLVPGDDPGDFSATLVRGEWSDVGAQSLFRGRPMHDGTTAPTATPLLDGRYLALAMAPIEAAPERAVWRVWDVVEAEWVSLERDLARGELDGVEAALRDRA